MSRLRGAFRPEDTAIIVYLVTISVTVTLFHKGVDHWWIYVLIHSASVLLIIGWVRYSSRSENPIIRFFRYWYIIFLLTVFYEQIDAFILGMHGHYLDRYIANFEKGLLGFHPSVWMERFASPPVTEIMNIAYNSYYWLIPILGLSLYLKRDFIPFRRMVFSISVAFFISYYGFILFPVVGPRYQLAGLYNGPLTGYVVTPLQQFIMKYGDIRGRCMPSSHVAVALVILLLAWSYRKRMAIFLTPLVIGLSIATVYNRYHYVSDVVMGVVVGLVAFYWGKRVYSPEKFSAKATGSSGR